MARREENALLETTSPLRSGDFGQAPKPGPASGYSAAAALITAALILGSTRAGAGVSLSRLRAGVLSVGGSRTSGYVGGVVPIAPPTITYGAPAQGTATQASYTLTPTVGGVGNVYTKTSGTLPPGLALNASTGVISGPPTTAGTYGSIVVRATNSAGYVEVTISITINAAPTIPTDELDDGTAGVLYAETVTHAGGTGNGLWTLSAGSLPAGATLTDNGDGTADLDIASPVAATSNFTLKFTDDRAVEVERVYALTFVTAHLFQETWADLAAWTKENSTNRVTVADLANHAAGVRGTSGLETAERRTSFVLPDVATIDYVLNKGAGWRDVVTGGFLQVYADADTRNAGLQNFASSGAENAYSILIFPGSIQIYEIAAGGYSQRVSQAITLGSGATTFRVILTKGASVNIKVYQGSTLRVDYTDASPPAGLGTGLLMGFGLKNDSGEKAHMGLFTVYDTDKGAP